MKKVTLAIILLLLLISSGGVAQTRPSVLDIVPIENIAKLKALRPSTTGIWAYVQGYYTRGDGGGGDFYWDSTNTSAANDGTIIAATGITTGRWIRQIRPHGDINVEWFGALPDSGVDESDRIQAAMDFSGGNHAIRFPLGDFIIEKTLLNRPTATGGTRFYKGLTMIGTSYMDFDGTTEVNKTTQLITTGDMPAKSIIAYNAPLDAKIMLDLTPDGITATTSFSLTVYPVLIKGIAFVGPASDSSVVGIHTQDFKNCHVSECHFRSMDTGINIHGHSFYGSITKSGFTTLRVGISTKQTANNLLIESCRINSVDYGIRSSYPSIAPKIRKCFIENVSYHAIQAEYTIYLSVIDNYFENIRGSLVFALGASGSTERLDALLNFNYNYVDCGNATNPFIVFYSLPPGGTVASCPAGIAMIAGNQFLNNPIASTTLIAGVSSPGFEFKQAVLIGNFYRYPNNMRIHPLNSTQINRLFDGQGSTVVLGNQLSPATSTPSILGIQEGFVKGMLRFNYDTSKFQGVASTTVGYADLH